MTFATVGAGGFVIFVFPAPLGIAEAGLLDKLRIL